MGISPFFIFLYRYVVSTTLSALITLSLRRFTGFNRLSTRPLDKSAYKNLFSYFLAKTCCVGTESTVL